MDQSVHSALQCVTLQALMASKRRSALPHVPSQSGSWRMLHTNWHEHGVPGMKQALPSAQQDCFRHAKQGGSVISTLHTDERGGRRQARGAGRQSTWVAITKHTRRTRRITCSTSGRRRRSSAPHSWLSTPVMMHRASRAAIRKTAPHRRYSRAGPLTAAHMAGLALRGHCRRDGPIRTTAGLARRPWGPRPKGVDVPSRRCFHGSHEVPPTANDEQEPSSVVQGSGAVG